MNASIWKRWASKDIAGFIKEFSSRRRARLATRGAEAAKVYADQKAALYARVSSSDQKTNLDSQVVRLTHFAVENKLSIAAVITEVGSAMNGKRPKLLKLLRDQSIKIIVVEHRDR